MFKHFVVVGPQEVDLYCKKNLGKQHLARVLGRKHRHTQTVCKVVGRFAYPNEPQKGDKTPSTPPAPYFAALPTGGSLDVSLLQQVRLKQKEWVVRSFGSMFFSSTLLAC